jgi:hypothetical protein
VCRLPQPACSSWPQCPVLVSATQPQPTGAVEADQERPQGRLLSGHAPADPGSAWCHTVPPVVSPLHAVAASQACMASNPGTTPLGPHLAYVGDVVAAGGAAAHVADDGQQLVAPRAIQQPVNEGGWEVSNTQQW